MTFPDASGTIRSLSGLKGAESGGVDDCYVEEEVLVVEDVG